ncbi:Serine threonine- kinase 36 [Brachionus plicatilis]|uniref:Serine threonine-kinase 36 n=1 Tax=Brachionus plicatilis TaxID=10195 RepID=A0A3M7SE48_BRAPC|nr:Serine threonine- kinase 36 [Brachionus plicatilis]
MKEQVWFEQIELDILVVVQSYFSSNLSLLEFVQATTSSTYVKYAKEILILGEILLNVKADSGFRLKEKTLICLITLCEILEQHPDDGNDWYGHVCSLESNLFDAFFKCMQQDEAELKKLIDFTGNRNAAQDIQEDFFHLGVAILAAFTYVPLNVSNKTQIQKLKVSKFLANKIMDLLNSSFAEKWLGFLRHPGSCINVLKAVYSLCMASPKMCIFISKNSTAINSLFDILSEKIQFPEMIVNEIIEMAVHTFTVLVIQLYDMQLSDSLSPKEISNQNDLFWDKRFVK